MDNTKARAVLVEMLGAENVTAESIDYCGWDYTSLRPDSACLDGNYTADQLEAIAAWMRDPKGVAG